MKIIIFLGAPGSGKGTQSDFLVQNNNYIKLSTGDLLREVTASGSELGNKISDIMKSGGLVSDDIVAEILNNKMNATNGKSNFIFDGFPRTLNQAKILKDIILNISDVESIDVILLDVDKDVVVKRISGRFMCSSCKENYHQEYKKTKVPGICDNCGSKDFVKREDDNAETVIKRIDSYNNQIQPIIDFYKNEYGVHKIIGSNHFDQVHSDIQAIVNK